MVYIPTIYIFIQQNNGTYFKTKNRLSNLRNNHKKPGVLYKSIKRLLKLILIPTPPLQDTHISTELNVQSIKPAFKQTI